MQHQSKKQKKRLPASGGCTRQGEAVPDSRRAWQPLPQQSALPLRAHASAFGLVMHAKNFCQTWNLNIYRQCRWQRGKCVDHFASTEWATAELRDRETEGLKDWRTAGPKDSFDESNPRSYCVQLIESEGARREDWNLESRSGVEECAELTQLAKGMIYFILFQFFVKSISISFVRQLWTVRSQVCTVGRRRMKSVGNLRKGNHF